MSDPTVTGAERGSCLQTGMGLVPFSYVPATLRLPWTPVELTSDKQLDPTRSLDLLLKGITLSLQVSCIPIQNVGVFWVDVNVLEEVVPHEGVVALRVVSTKACGAMAALSHARLSKGALPRMAGYSQTPETLSGKSPSGSLGQ